MSVKVKPSEQVKGGGMDGPHLIKKARHMEFDYPDKQGVSQGTGVGLKIYCVNESGDDREQFYRASDLSRFVPSDDGLRLEPASGHGDGNLVDSSRFAIFVREMDNAGFNTEESDISEDISEIEGCIFAFEGKSLPVVSGDDRVVPMPSKLLALPDEKNDWTKKFARAGKGKGSAGSKRSARGAAASSGSRRKKKGSSRRGASANGEDVDIDALTHGYLVELLEKDYDEIGRDELASIVLKKARRDDNRKEIVARVFEEDFLTAYPDDWEYADETVYAIAGE